MSADGNFRQKFMIFFERECNYSFMMSVELNSIAHLMPFDDENIREEVEKDEEEEIHDE